jgi:uncharacterized protein YkwD
MSLRYVSVVFLAAVLAMVAVLGASAIQPREADAANTVTVKGCTGTNVTLKTIEKRMLDLHNKTRASKGLARLCVHPALQKAARAHSLDMINRDYFSHNTKGSGKTFSTRIKEAGYRYRTAGENIAGGSGTLGSADSIFKGWMNSTGHRGNILNKNFKEIGIGAATGNFKGRDGYTMWTADFGSR